MKNIYERVDENKWKSALVVGFFVAFVLGVAYLFGYLLDTPLSFLGFGLIFSGVMTFGSYFYSDKIVLMMSGAREASRKHDFDFYTVTENLCMTARIPVPKLYVIEDTALNAFATGRNPEHGVVVATTGLLKKLNRTELEGVVAHELSHIKNYDTLLASIVTILVGFVALLADWFLRISFRGGNSDEDKGTKAIFMVLGLVLALLSPIIAQLIQLAISRRREFLADASAAKITKYPKGLADALKKLAGDKEPLEAANKATAHLYIVNPLKNRYDAIGWFSGLFATHPPIVERIKALEA